MPKCLRRPTLSLAHEGHQGIVRTKQLLRQKMWWPGMDAEAETVIKECIPCQSTMPPSPPEPLHPSTMPSKPWHSIQIDLCGPFPTGESLFVSTRVLGGRKWRLSEPHLPKLSSAVCRKVSQHMDCQNKSLLIMAQI